MAVREVLAETGARNRIMAAMNPIVWFLGL